MVNLTRQRPVKFMGGFLSVDRGERGLEAGALWPTTRSKNEITKARICLFLCTPRFRMFKGSVSQVKSKKSRPARKGRTGFYETEVVEPLL